ncbi:MAG: gliding motility-associated C-terminal domain-containing protein [Cyclobacteriaceae bacterium]|nr:gliding motility-associated C-terminal domain-containing protein [Cyclobacteriaceae bacterium]
MMVRFFIGILFLIPIFVQAQYVSDLFGRFQVDERKGCAPLTVTIIDTDLQGTGPCTGTNPCDISWGDGSVQQQNVFTHVYTQPGTYTLRLLHQNVGAPDEIQIVVTPNIQPTFNVFTCSGNEVQVRVTDTNYDAYIINFNDGSPEVQVPKGSLATANHTYASSGNKNISVRGKDVNADDNCGSNTQIVEALTTLPAPFINQLNVINADRIDLNFAGANNIQYRLEIATNNNTSFQLAQTIFNTSSVSVSNLRPDDNYYCFRLGAYDPCNNTTNYSNIICSANVDATAQNNQNQVSWITHAAGITNFTIERDGSLLTTTAGTSYTDNAVVCRTEYCYQLVSNYTNGSQSSSLAKCVTAFSSDIPTPITNATAIVTQGVELTWQQDPAFQTSLYRIFRKSGGANAELIGQSGNLQFTDANYTTEGEFCYHVGYTDACNNTAPTGSDICPIRLTGTLTPENYSSLTWSVYTGWSAGVNEYRIEKYNEQGSLILTVTVTPGTTSFIDTDIDPTAQVNSYLIKAVANEAGLGEAVSNEIILIKEPKLFYPTAFTPDGQGPTQNETFMVFGQFITTFEMRIFNRWGELLFVSTDRNNGWDGTYRGKEQPEGTYVFTATLVDLAGRSFNHSGSVVLLRKK